MSVSEQQTDLDAVVETLRTFEAGDTVTLATGSGSITARVTDARWHADGARVTLADRDADRRVRVSTEWYGGWLDPLVDAYPAPVEADADTDLDPDLGRPLGTLVDACLVARADRKEQYGRQ